MKTLQEVLSELGSILDYRFGTSGGSGGSGDTSGGGSGGTVPPSSGGYFQGEITMTPDMLEVVRVGDETETGKKVRVVVFNDQKRRVYRNTATGYKQATEFEPFKNYKYMQTYKDTFLWNVIGVQLFKEEEK